MYLLKSLLIGLRLLVLKKKKSGNLKAVKLKHIHVKNKYELSKVI